MQVSNSTGRSADYRVGANTGGNNIASTDDLNTNSPSSGVQTPGGGSDELDIQLTTSGSLAPGDSLTWDTWPTTVEFWIDGQMVASASFTEDPGPVTLVATVETASGFAVETSAGVPA
jgi:hypothetical protein